MVKVAGNVIVNKCFMFHCSALLMRSSEAVVLSQCACDCVYICLLNFLVYSMCVQYVCTRALAESPLNPSSSTSRNQVVDRSDEKGAVCVYVCRNHTADKARSGQHKDSR